MCPLNSLQLDFRETKGPESLKYFILEDLGGVIVTLLGLSHLSPISFMVTLYTQMSGAKGKLTYCQQKSWITPKGQFCKSHKQTVALPPLQFSGRPWGIIGDKHQKHYPFGSLRAHNCKTAVYVLLIWK